MALVGDAAREEDEKTFQLCDDVLNLLCESDSRFLNIRGEIVKMKFSFKDGTFRFSVLEDPDAAFVYFYRYGPQRVALMRSKVSLAIRNCEELSQALKAPVFNAVNVAASAGADMVGFLSAVCGVSDPAAIRFTLVDPVQNFREYVATLIWKLRTGEYGRASEVYQQMTRACEFRECSFQHDKEEYFTVIKDADIIIMPRVLSIIYKDNLHLSVVEDLREHLKDNALLILIDSPTFHQYAEKGFKCLYQELSDRKAHRVFAIPVPSSYEKFSDGVSDIVADATNAIVSVWKKC